MAFEFNVEDVRRQIQGDGSNGAGSLKSSARAAVRFRLHAVLDSAETEKRGYPKYREAVFFSRRDVVRGKQDGVDREATEEHFREYAAEFAEFKEWMKNPQAPVYALPWISPAVLRLLDDGQITTIEELATAPNLTFLDIEGQVKQRVSIDAVPELKEPRELARQWLGKRPTQMSAAIPESEADKLRRQVAELQQKLNQPAKNKGGRPKGSKNKPKAPDRGKDAEANP